MKYLKLLNNTKFFYDSKTTYNGIKMPQDVLVIYQAHDNSENEVHDNINRVSLIDFDKLPKSDWQINKGLVVSLRS